MPIVTVTSPLTSGTARLTHAVAEAIADALELGDGDVLASHIPCSPWAVSGGRTSQEWAIVTVHGGVRPAERMTSAVDRARQAVLAAMRAAGLTAPEVWVEWVTPDVP